MKEREEKEDCRISKSDRVWRNILIEVVRVESGEERVEKREKKRRGEMRGRGESGGNGRENKIRNK